MTAISKFLEPNRRFILKMDSNVDNGFVGLNGKAF
jgi:hypothetical protein